MSGETSLTIIGNLGDDPMLRFLSSGIPVCNFKIASTPRVFDKASNDWKDGSTLWMGCAVWRDQAEHVAETLTKGMRVIVTGRLVSREWETKEGEKRTVMELDVDEVGPSLRNATAKVTKSTKGAGGFNSPKPAAAGVDPWATGTQAVSNDEPPF